MSRVTRAASKALSVSPTEATASPKLRTRRGITPDVETTPSKNFPAKRTRRANSSIDVVPSPLRRSRRLSTNSEEVSTPTTSHNVRGIRPAITLAENPVPEEDEFVQTSNGGGRPPRNRRETISSESQDSITSESKRKEDHQSNKQNVHSEKGPGKTETPTKVNVRRMSRRFSDNQTPVKVQRSVVKLKRCSSHSESSDLEHEKPKPIYQPVSAEKGKPFVENAKKSGQEKTPTKSATNKEDEKHKDVQRRSDVDAINASKKSPPLPDALKSQHATNPKSAISYVSPTELAKKDDQKRGIKEEQSDRENSNKAKIVRKSSLGLEGAKSNANETSKCETPSKIDKASEIIEVIESEDSSEDSDQNEHDNELEPFIIADSETNQSQRESSESEAEEESRKNEKKPLETEKEGVVKSCKSHDMPMSISDDEETIPFLLGKEVPTLDVNLAENENCKGIRFGGGDISSNRLVLENSVMSISSEDVIPETQQIEDMDIDIENEAKTKTLTRNSSICVESIEEQNEISKKSSLGSTSHPSPRRSTTLNQSSVGNGMDISQDTNGDNLDSENLAGVNLETLSTASPTTQLAVAGEEPENEIDLMNKSRNAETESLGDRRSLIVHENSETEMCDVSAEEEKQLNDLIAAIDEHQKFCDEEVTKGEQNVERWEKHNQSTEGNDGDVSTSRIENDQSVLIEGTNMENTTVVENEKAKKSDGQIIPSTPNVSFNKAMPVEEKSDADIIGNNDTTSNDPTLGSQQYKSPPKAQTKIQSGENFVDQIKVESQDIDRSNMFSLKTSNKSLPPAECESLGKGKSPNKSEQNASAANNNESVSKNDDSMKQHLSEFFKSHSSESFNTTLTFSRSSSTSCTTIVSSSKRRSLMSIQSDWNKLNNSEEEDIYDMLVKSGRESINSSKGADISLNSSKSEPNLDKKTEISSSMSSVRSERDGISCGSKSANDDTTDSTKDSQTASSSSSSEDSDTNLDPSEIKVNSYPTGTTNRKLSAQKRSSIMNSHSKRMDTSTKKNTSDLLNGSKSSRGNPIEGFENESSSDTDESTSDVPKAHCVVECMSEVIEKILKGPTVSSTRMDVDEVETNIGADRNIEVETVESRHSLNNLYCSSTRNTLKSYADSSNDSNEVDEAKNKTMSSAANSVESDFSCDSEVNEEEIQSAPPAKTSLSKLPATSPSKSNEKEANATEARFSGSCEKPAGNSYEKQANIIELSVSKLSETSATKSNEKHANPKEISLSRTDENSPRKLNEIKAVATELSLSKSPEKMHRKCFENQGLVKTVISKPPDESKEKESISETDDLEEDDEIKLKAADKSKAEKSRDSINKSNVSANKKPASTSISNESSIEDNPMGKSDENNFNNSLQLKSPKVQKTSIENNPPQVNHASNSRKYENGILQAKTSSGKSSDESSIESDEGSLESDVGSTDSDESYSESDVAEKDSNKSRVKKPCVNTSNISSFQSKNSRQSLENSKRKSFQQTSSDESDDSDIEDFESYRKKLNAKTSMISESKNSSNNKNPLTSIVDRKGRRVVSSESSSNSEEDDDEIDEHERSRNFINNSKPYISKTQNESSNSKSAKALQMVSSTDATSEESDTSDEEVESHPKKSSNGPQKSSNGPQKSFMQPQNTSHDITDQMNSETSDESSNQSTSEERVTIPESKSSTTAAAPLSQRLSSQNESLKTIQSDLKCRTDSKVSKASGFDDMDDQGNKTESPKHKLERKKSLQRRISVPNDVIKSTLKLNDSKTTGNLKRLSAHGRESLLNRSAPQPIVSKNPKALVERQQLSFSQNVKQREESDETDSIETSSEEDSVTDKANRASTSQADNVSKIQKKSIKQLCRSKAVEEDDEEDSSDSSLDENIKRTPGKVQRGNSKNLPKSARNKDSTLLVENATSDEASCNKRQSVENIKNKSKLDCPKSLNVSLKRPSAPVTPQMNKSKGNLSLKHTLALKVSQKSNVTQVSETSSLKQESTEETNNANISTKSEMPIFQSFKEKNQSTPASNREKINTKFNDQTYVSSDEKTKDLSQRSKVASTSQSTHISTSTSQSARPEDTSRAGRVSVVELLLKQAARDLLNRSKETKQSPQVQSSSDNSFENYPPMSEKNRMALKKLKQKKQAHDDKNQLFESEALKEILINKINEATKAGKIADRKKKKETVSNKPISEEDRLKNAVAAFKTTETPETETEVLRAFFAFNRTNKGPTKLVIPREELISAYAAYNLTDQKIDKDKPSTSGIMPKKKHQEDVLKEKSTNIAQKAHKRPQPDDTEPSSSGKKKHQEDVLKKKSTNTSQKAHKRPQPDDIELQSKKLKLMDHESKVKKQIDTKPKKSHLKESNKSATSTLTSSSSQNETMTSIGSTSLISSDEWQVRDVKPKKVLKVLNEIPFGFKESAVTPKKVNGFEVSNATPKTIGWKVRSLTDAGLNVPEISKKSKNKLKRKRKYEEDDSSPSQVWTSSGYFQVSDVINPIKQKKYRVAAPGASTEFIVQPLSSGKLKSSGSSEYFSSSALEFKQKAHFSKHIQRESSKEMLRRKIKGKY